MVARGYKDTEIGVIPVEWEVVKVGKHTKLMGGYAFKSKDAKEFGTRWLKIANVGIKKIKWEQVSHLEDTYQEEYKKFLLKKNDIVLAMTRPILSMKLKIAKITNDDIPALLNQRVGKFIFDDKVNDEFLYQLFQHIDFVKLLMLKIMGTDPPNVSSEQLESIKIPLPPLKEQEKIADILSTADEKIDAIEGQIQKAETLKKGLLQKLLSEGIGHSEFKDSELGKIPESWEVVELAKITTILLSNVDKKSKEDEHDVKLCNYMDVYNNQYITNDLVYMEATAKDNQIEKFQLQINDVIITKDSETKDDIAIPAVVKETFENLICGYHLAVLRPKENILYGVYLMKAIQSVNVHKHFEKLANGITRFGLTSSAINQALIPLPPIEEQNEIANILSSVDNKLVVLRAKKEKYETLKKGLLQKLLSGEVRV